MKLRELVEGIEAALVSSGPPDLDVVIEPRLLGPIQDPKHLRHGLVHVWRESTQVPSRTRGVDEDLVTDRIHVELAWRPDSAAQKVGRGDAWDLGERIVGRICDSVLCAGEAHLRWVSTADRVVGEFLVTRISFDSLRQAERR